VSAFSPIGNEEVPFPPFACFQKPPDVFPFPSQVVDEKFFVFCSASILESFWSSGETFRTTFLYPHALVSLLHSRLSPDRLKSKFPRNTRSSDSYLYSIPCCPLSWLISRAPCDIPGFSLKDSPLSLIRWKLIQGSFGSSGDYFPVYLLISRVFPFCNTSAFAPCHLSPDPR